MREGLTMDLGVYMLTQKMLANFHGSCWWAKRLSITLGFHLSLQTPNKQRSFLQALMAKNFGCNSFVVEDAPCQRQIKQGTVLRRRLHSGLGILSTSVLSSMCLHIVNRFMKLPNMTDLRTWRNLWSIWHSVPSTWWRPQKDKQNEKVL